MEKLTLGPFAVTEDGLFWPRPMHPVPTLHFAWRGRRCEAQLDDGALRMVTAAGRIPFTAESRAARPDAFSALQDLAAGLPGGWRARLLPDHHIRLEAEAKLSGPTTAPGLITALVRFALALDPHLDRLEAAGAS
jgi:hypothetical protein